MRVDLHIHSSLSDGTLSPKEIVDKAKVLGLDCISITDHDCIGAIEQAKDYAQGLGIDYINGVELSTYATSEVHILGYGFDNDDSQLNEKLDEFAKMRKQRALAILDRLYDMGIKMDRSTFPIDSSSVGRLHIAKMLVEQGFVSSIPDAFDKYLGSKGKAYIPSKRITPLKGVELIKQARGFAVIAHPLRFLQRNSLRPLIEGLKPYGLEGIEVFYPTHDSKTVDELKSLTRRYKLIGTGGTDYHGENRNVELGSVSVDIDGYTKSKLNIKR
ncbi:MAG: PHP domain-containing protein [Clostridia bacterium]|nr:PHP domain-containing protein [Clostridia bacterium]MDE7329204.1 PHP domain-containing protein [Clostridia bacterium]